MHLILTLTFLQKASCLVCHDTVGVHNTVCTIKLAVILSACLEVGKSPNSDKAEGLFDEQSFPVPPQRSLLLNCMQHPASLLALQRELAIYYHLLSKADI